jgi:hypothetical protein
LELFEVKSPYIYPNEVFMGTSTITSQPSTSGTRWKAVAIPPEHGAWGFLLEPILLGLLVAPSWAGLCLSLAVTGAFLVRHPLKIAFVDRQRGKRYARSILAERVVLIYGTLAVIGLIAAVVLAGLDMLLPLVLSAPLVAVLLAGTLVNRGRDLLPELAGPSALAATAASLGVAGGEALDMALALWVILLARNIPSILYVRARLRLDKHKPAALAPVLAINGIAVVGVLVLALAGLAPGLAVLAVTLLALRAAIMLAPNRPQVRVQTIGFMEMGLGLLTVLLAAVGYAVGW